MTEPVATASLGDRLLAVLRRLHGVTRRRPSPRVQRLLLVVASVAFVGGALLSARALDVDLGDLRWTPLLVAGLVLVPLTVLTNAEEYRVSGRMLGHAVGIADALRVTLFATAANLLPLPGAFVVRTQALRGRGSATRSAASATAIVGLGWIGMSLLLAGVLLVPAGRAALGVGGVVVALVVLAVAGGWLRSQVDEGQAVRLMARLVAVEAAAVAVNAVRLVLVLAGLGVDADLVSAFVLAVSSSLASATGILPGGFGVREGIAAALGPLVGLSAAAGFLATAVNRILGLLVLAPLAGLSATLLRPPALPDDAPTGTEEAPL